MIWQEQTSLYKIYTKKSQLSTIIYCRFLYRKNNLQCF